MEDFVSGTAALDGEQHMISAAFHIVRALSASKNLNNEMRRILTELGSHLSTMTKLNESEAERARDVENRLKFAEKNIMSFQSMHLKIRDAGSHEVSGYIQAVDEVRRLAEILESMPSSETRKVRQLLDQAHNILQMAMAKLQKELAHILAQNMEHDKCFIFQSCEETLVDEGFIVSIEDDSLEDVSQKGSSGSEYEHYLVDLVHPDVIALIKSIAEVMFASRYDQEFCQVFISFWKEALNDYLIILKVKQLSIEDVLKMEWKCLNSRIKKWCRATKSVIGIYLASEKRLFDRILGGFGTISSSCFVDASKASILCLLNFGQAVTIGPGRPEKLFCLLDMYEVLSKLLRDVDDLFAEGAGSLVRMEFRELLNRLGDSAKVILLELGNYVASDTSTIPFTNGGIHPLTRYVMNYIMLLGEYGYTINLLLDERNVVNPGEISKTQVAETVSPYVASPVAHLLQSVASILEANLDAKSDLYRHEALKHIFMMNNIHYMVRKVEISLIKAYFGDEWIRRHVGKFRRYATSYERIAWSSMLTLLKDDENKGKAILKQKCRKFNRDFEEVYKIQTGWLIPDIQLREELRISTSQKVIHAYRPFTGRIKSSICDKCIKYAEDDLQNYIWDLFEGLPKSINHQRRI